MALEIFTSIYTAAQQDTLLGRVVKPVVIEDAASSYTFEVNDIVEINGVIYRCTSATSLMPHTLYTQNGKILYITINGEKCYMVKSQTLNTGWVKWFDIKDRFFVEKRLTTKADKATTLAGYGIGNAYTKTETDTLLAALTRRTRLTDFSLATLKSAVADQNLEKYGLKVGDYKTINGHDYVIAGLNPMKGAGDVYTVSVDHVGLIVLPHTQTKWNASGNTYTGADSRGQGYLNCDLHYYLKNTVLPLVQADLGSANLLAHKKRLSNTINQTGLNPEVLALGEQDGIKGASSDTGFDDNCYIVSLSEVQVLGFKVWSSSPFDTGEADQQLEVFRHFKHSDIFGNESVWLRDVATNVTAVLQSTTGESTTMLASTTEYVAGLVLFH